MSLGVSSGLAFCAILLGMLDVSGCDAAIACTVPRCMFHVIVRCMLDATLHVACYCALHVGCHVHVAWQRTVQYIHAPVACCTPEWMLHVAHRISCRSGRGKSPRRSRPPPSLRRTVLALSGHCQLETATSTVTLRSATLSLVALQLALGLSRSTRAR